MHPQHITNLILGIAIGECQGFTSGKVVSIMLDILFSRLKKFLSTIWFHICFGGGSLFSLCDNILADFFFFKETIDMISYTCSI